MTSLADSSTALPSAPAKGANTVSPLIATLTESECHDLFYVHIGERVLESPNPRSTYRRGNYKDITLKVPGCVFEGVIAIGCVVILGANNRGTITVLTDTVVEITGDRTKFTITRLTPWEMVAHLGIITDPTSSTLTV